EIEPMTVEAERLSRLIGDIYDVVLDPSLWRSALRDIAKFVGGSASALYSKNARSVTGASHYNWGLQQRYLQSYWEKYIKYDPTTVGQLVFNVEDVYSAVDFITFEELFESRFYKEWIRPQGLIDHVGATLDKTATSVAACVVFRGEQEGPVDDQARMRMRLLVPHIRRAVLIGNVIDLRKSEASSFATLFDSLADGVILVDAHARIGFANVPAQTIIAEGEILRDAGGRLSAVDTAADKALRNIFAATPGGDTEVGAEGVAIPLSSANDEQWTAHVLPLTSGDRRREGVEHGATAAVFVRKVQLESPSLMKMLATRYKLTPAELRVLQGVIDVGGVPAIADALGISPTTVRTHMKSLFEKTGVRRQADLVKLIASHSSPFVS
ncbi:MAG TPA: helix-turn-helix transcriptional regulator, partial [Xanthobacteraceae bacterium]